MLGLHPVTHLPIHPNYEEVAVGIQGGPLLPKGVHLLFTRLQKEKECIRML